MNTNSLNQLTELNNGAWTSETGSSHRELMSLGLNVNYSCIICWAEIWTDRGRRRVAINRSIGGFLACSSILFNIQYRALNVNKGGKFSSTNGKLVKLESEADRHSRQP